MSINNVLNNDNVSRGNFKHLLIDFIKIIHYYKDFWQNMKFSTKCGKLKNYKEMFSFDKKYEFYIELNRRNQAFILLAPVTYRDNMKDGKYQKLINVYLFLLCALCLQDVSNRVSSQLSFIFSLSNNNRCSTIQFTQARQVFCFPDISSEKLKKVAFVEAFLSFECR